MKAEEAFNETSKERKLREKAESSLRVSLMVRLIVQSWYLSEYIWNNWLIYLNYWLRVNEFILLIDLLIEFWCIFWLTDFMINWSINDLLIILTE